MTQNLNSYYFYISQKVYFIKILFYQLSNIFNIKASINIYLKTSLRFYALCSKSFRLYAQYFIIFLCQMPKLLQIQRSVVLTIAKYSPLSIIEPSNLFHDVWFDILYSMESALSIPGFLKILKSSKHHVQIGAPIELSLIYSSA